VGLFFSCVRLVQPSRPPKKLRHPDRSEAQWREPPHFAQSYNTLTMPEQAYVYIMASSFQRLYIGITTEIEIRVAPHKNGSFPGSFISRYKINKLVYFERFAKIPEAIAREKQLKKWSQIKKLRLIICSESYVARSKCRTG
jgi:putative endonuclease